MAQHGYLHDEYDRDLTGDDRDRDRNERWRNRGEDRNFMFDREERERSWHSRDHDEDRGSSSRFSNHDPEGRLYRGGVSGQNRSDADEWFGGRTDWEHSSRKFRSHPDDHYRSWRDRQIQALDRDYADYCREREQQFNQDFDSWRSSRQTAKRDSSTETLELNNPTTLPGEADGSPSPISNATLGTNNPENSGTGRGGRGS